MNYYYNRGNVYWELGDKESDKLEIHLVSNDTEVFDRHYEIPLVDIDSELMGIPDIE